MPTDPAEHLAAFPVVIKLPVQWGDQDAFRHVNNTVYFRWFESARIAYLDQIGLSDLLESEQIGPILAAIGCNYRRPLTYPDTVHVGARITRLGTSSMTMEHRLFSEAQGVVAAEGDSTIVVLDYAQNRSCPIPAAVRQAIARLEGKAL